MFFALKTECALLDVRIGGYKQQPIEEMENFSFRMPFRHVLRILHACQSYFINGTQKMLLAVSTNNYFVRFCSFSVGEKLLCLTLNNYGSIFVKIDRNVLMLNEFSASAFDSEIRNEFNVLKILSKHTQMEEKNDINKGK